MFLESRRYATVQEILQIFNLYFSLGWPEVVDCCLHDWLVEEEPLVFRQLEKHLFALHVGVVKLGGQEALFEHVGGGLVKVVVRQIIVID